MFADYVVSVPIAPRPTVSNGWEFRVAAIGSKTKELQGLVAGVIDVLRMEFGVDAPGHTLSRFAELDSDGFVREVKKRKPKSSTLSPAGLRALRDLYAAQTPPILEARAAIIEHERGIASAVHAAYGLTPEDLSLLRSTAPPRMPPGW